MLYHAHGEYEQYHSEIKTYMDLELLPSEKFTTNKLVLEHAIITYNILWMIGQEAIRLKVWTPQHNVKRRRARTVISNQIVIWQAM